jgi:TctA family transporter
MMAIFGITLIALISGKSLMKGIMVGALGLLMATIGEDPQTGVVRFAFGQVSLYEGIDLISVVVGVFALTEMISLAMEGGSISAKGTKEGENAYSIRQVFAGMRELVVHWFLFLRCSIIGYLIGVIPGLGGEAAGWMCYGHAVQSSKDPESFGKGNVRGVIAPEAANNAKEAGALIPTVAFGVPGSSGMAVLLGAFIILGLTPGPMMLVNELPTVWAMVWLLVAANLMGVVLFLFMAQYMARITDLRANLLVPFVIVLIMFGSYLATLRWENLLITVAMGFFGYGMKLYDYPRPPLLIGIVLGKIAEVNMHKSLQLWGWKFLLRPITFVLLLITVLSVLYPLLKKLYRKARPQEVAA